MLGWCQVMVMAGVGWAAWSLTSALPYWPINPQITSSPEYLFQIDFNRALWTVLPAAIFWGASFPLALAAVAAASKRQDPGHLVGGVYAANTVGAIIGALLFALVMVGGFGTQVAQRTLLAIAALAAIVMLAPAWKEGRPTLEGSGMLRAVGVIALAVLLGGAVAPVPGVLIAYGRYAATWIGHHGEILFTGEGTHSSMAVSRQTDGKLNYHNAGKVQASANAISAAATASPPSLKS
jgi:spermidine synthase